MPEDSLEVGADDDCGLACLEGSLFELTIPPPDDLAKHAASLRQQPLYSQAVDVLHPEHERSPTPLHAPLDERLCLCRSVRGYHDIGLVLFEQTRRAPRVVELLEAPPQILLLRELAPQRNGRDVEGRRIVSPLRQIPFGRLEVGGEGMEHGVPAASQLSAELNLERVPCVVVYDDSGHQLTAPVRGTAIEHLVIDGDRAGGSVLPRELTGALPAAADDIAAPRTPKTRHPREDGFYVCRICEDGGIARNFWQRAHVRAHDGAVVGHRLEQRQTKALVAGREEQALAATQERAQSA